MKFTFNIIRIVLLLVAIVFAVFAWQSYKDCAKNQDAQAVLLRSVDYCSYACYENQIASEGFMKRFDGVDKDAMKSVIIGACLTQCIVAAEKDTVQFIKTYNKTPKTE